MEETGPTTLLRLGKLVPLVYPQLHRDARRYMAGERQRHTLQETALLIKVINDHIVAPPRSIFEGSPTDLSET
jgi:hypothetical protein